MKTTNQKGFGVIEALLTVIVLVALGGAGWYVYHKNHKPIVNTSHAGQSTTSVKAGTNHFMLAQWNVQAPYSGNLTLTVQSIDSEHAVLSSKQLLDHANSAGCIGPNSGNFVIQRYSPNDYMTDNRMNDTGSALTASQAYAKSSVNLKKVGGYYYLYQTIKAPCAEPVYNALPLFSQTDAAFKSIAANLEEASTASTPINTSSATQLIKSFYDQYVTLEKAVPPQATQATRLVQQYGTTNLVNYITPPAGYSYYENAVVCAQALPDSLSVAVGTSTPTYATGTVTETFGSGPIKISVDVVSQSGTLKIDSITCSPVLTPQKGGE